MYKKLRKTEGERMEDQVHLIEEVINKMKKKPLKICLNIKELRLKRTRR